MIQYIAEEVKLPLLQKQKTNNWIKETAAEYSKKIGDIAYVFCSDKRILEVNKQYLNHEYYTDIITFDYVEDGLISGDIFISIDRVKENAKLFSTSMENELNRVLVHGVLHLLGYKDKIKKDKTLMTFKENYYLNVLKVS